MVSIVPISFTADFSSMLLTLRIEIYILVFDPHIDSNPFHLVFGQFYQFIIEVLIK